jgi:hypothetical protein
MIRKFALGLLVGMAALANPARANTVQVSFHISYFAPDTFTPGNPVVPTNFVGTQLSGQASFTADTLSPLPPQIDIGHLNVGGGFSTAFIVADPGLLFFSFTAFAFPQVSPSPQQISPSPPNIRIGALDFSIPSPPQIRVAGRIVAFDDPEVVGTWDTSLSAVPAVPETSTWLMMINGFAGISVLAYRRKSKHALMAA